MIPLKVVGEEGLPVPLVDFPGGQNPPAAELEAAGSVVLERSGVILDARVAAGAGS